MPLSHLFREYRLLWGAIAFYLAFLFLSLPFLPTVVDHFANHLGRRHFGLLVNTVIVFAALVAMLLLMRLPMKTWLWAAGPTLATVLLAMHIHNPQERLHIVGYLILGVLLYLASGRPSWKGTLWVVFTVGMVGLLDEAVQGMLPNRYWDIKDVAIDTVGGAIGVWLSHFLCPPPPASS